MAERKRQMALDESQRVQESMKLMEAIIHARPLGYRPPSPIGARRIDGPLELNYGEGGTSLMSEARAVIRDIEDVAYSTGLDDNALLMRALELIRSLLKAAR